MSEPQTRQSFFNTSSQNPYKYAKMDDHYDNDEIGLCELNGNNADNDNDPISASFNNNRTQKCETVKRIAIAALVFITFLLLIIGLITAIYFFERPRTYKGHKVIKIIPKDVQQFNSIIEIEKKFKIEFWNDPYYKDPTEPILMQISPGEQETQLVNEFNQWNISFSVVIEDLHQAIEEERAEHEDIDNNETEFNFGRYHNFDEIIYYIETEVKSNPNAKVNIIGKSFEGREIPVIVITDNDNSNSKPVILIDSLIHSKEWVTGATTLYIINELLNNKDLNHYLRKFEFHIIPVFNPDGYAYTWRYDRLWRKTRSRSLTSMLCRGADANRNFDNNFCTVDEENESPCSDNYCGDYVFSEQEVEAFVEYVKNLNQTRTFGAYFSLHSFKQLWMYPYAHTKELPNNYLQLEQLSKAAVNAIKSVHGTIYKSGPTFNILYKASGVSTDWMFDTMMVKLVFTVELRDNGHYGHLLPKELVLPTAEETWTGIRSVLDLI